MKNEFVPAVWPYDEVTLTQGQTASEFIFGSPWLNVKVSIPQPLTQRVAEIAQKLSSGELAGEDFEEVKWLFSQVASYPLCYFLPTPRDGKHLDSHKISGFSLKGLSSSDVLKKVSQISGNTLIEKRAQIISASESFSKEWTWDVESSLSLAQLETGYDPLTLFSTARRFHLLESIETNKTDELNSYMREIKNDTQKFSKASALIVRQNHYVTQMCDQTLRGALVSSQSADRELIDFIQAESGHDSILAKALGEMGQSPDSVPALESVQMLMDIFRLIGQKNFLAFCMVIDMFERSSYQDHDPLAQLLTEGGQKSAGDQIDIHKEINDSGEHENMAIGLLKSVAPVDADYAYEALRLAELATRSMYFFSAELLKQVKSV